MIGDLTDPRNGAEIVVGVPQSLGDERGEGITILGERLGKEANAVKELAEQMGQKLCKYLGGAVFMVEITFAKNVLGNGISHKADDLGVVWNQLCAFYAVLLNVKQNVIAFISI